MVIRQREILPHCFDLGYIEHDTMNEGQNLIEPAKITLNGYIKFVKNQK